MKSNSVNKYGLPSTRFALFLDVVKQKWRTLILIGILFTLFSLPSLATLFFKDFYLASNELTGTTDTAPYGLSIIYAVFCVSLLILSIGASGISKVLLHMSYEEGYDFFSDFKLGVKQNIKTNILATLIYCVILYLTLFINISFNDQFLKYIPLGICQGIAFPILLVIFITNSIYDWKFSDSIRNSGIIYIRYFIFILLFSIGLLSVLLFELIPNIILRYVIMVLFLIIIEPFILIGFKIYMNYCLDEGINKDNYPSIYRKGLFKSSKEANKKN